MNSRHPPCAGAALPSDDFEAELPSAEALLAGTLALMTGVAEHPLKGMQPLKMRQLMAAKVVSNLFFLAEHPHCSAPFRAMLLRLRMHWQRVAGPDALRACGDTQCDSSDGQCTDSDAPAPGPHWHAPPARVQ
jgi:hypothetical protein